jgi:hypothetical protein
MCPVEGIRFKQFDIVDRPPSARCRPAGPESDQVTTPCGLLAARPTTVRVRTITIRQPLIILG